MKAGPLVKFSIFTKAGKTWKRNFKDLLAFSRNLKFNLLGREFYFLNNRKAFDPYSMYAVKPINFRPSGFLKINQSSRLAASRSKINIYVRDKSPCESLILEA